MAQTKKPRRGRPPREPGEPTLQALVFRPSPDTRKLVEDSAKATGHSLSAEIDRRLRQAYWDKDRHRSEAVRAFGGEHNFALGFLLARLATGVEHFSTCTWQGNGPVWREVATAIVGALQVMQGLGGATVELPYRTDGLPNPAWDVETLSRQPGHTGPTRWHFVINMIDRMLRDRTTLTWPIVEIMKPSHDDLREDIMPSADQLRRLYGHIELAGTPVT